MYFQVKNILKNNFYHTLKYPISLVLNGQTCSSLEPNPNAQPLQSCRPELYYITLILKQAVHLVFQTLMQYLYQARISIYFLVLRYQNDIVYHPLIFTNFSLQSRDISFLANSYFLPTKGTTNNNEHPLYQIINSTIINNSILHASHKTCNSIKYEVHATPHFTR